MQKQLKFYLYKIYITVQQLRYSKTIDSYKKILLTNGVSLLELSEIKDSLFDDFYEITIQKRNPKVMYGVKKCRINYIFLL